MTVYGLLVTITPQALNHNKHNPQNNIPLLSDSIQTLTTTNIIHKSGSDKSGFLHCHVERPTGYPHCHVERPTGVETSLYKSSLKISPFASLSRYDSIWLISHLLFCHSLPRGFGVRTVLLKKVDFEDNFDQSDAPLLKKADFEDRCVPNDGVLLKKADFEEKLRFSAGVILENGSF